jgi:recombination DNA repair RAD52 pathway protein
METPATFSETQVSHLLQPIKTTRVLSDGKGHSHVSQQDITAHLIRMFGFGAFDVEVIDRELLFETSEVKVNRAGKEYVAWDVAYRSLVRLVIRNEHGEKVAHYENGSVGSAQNQPSRADAHDLAYKSAISLSIKRAAIALGDQFGLSLYNKGQTAPLVIRTLVGNEEVSDLQADIPQQVSLGNDEIDRTETSAPEPAKGSVDGLEDFVKSITSAVTETDLNDLWAVAVERGISADVRNFFSEQKKMIQTVAQMEAKA